jgi:hypothetical protein
MVMVIQDYMEVAMVGMAATVAMVAVVTYSDVIEE